MYIAQKALLRLHVEMDEAEQERWHHNLPKSHLVARKALAAAIGAIPKHRNGKSGFLAMTLFLTSNRRQRRLNKQFRNMDRPTNVLAFPLPGERAGDWYLGDLSLALGVLKKEAREQRKELSHHFSHLVIHGLLHLLGYDHDDETRAKRMEKLEVRILERLGISDPYI